MPAVLGKRNPAVIALALLGAAIALLVLRFGPAPSPAKAASHREAPLISTRPPGGHHATSSCSAATRRARATRST